MRDRDPLDVIADVACPHVHHHAMCAPCAADAIRPELDRAVLVRNAANAMAGVQKRRADRLRKELEHAKAALARDNEGIRLWMLTCAEATERHRQNAARSEAAAEEAEAAIERVRALDKPEVAGTRLYDPAREQADQDLGHADDCEWHDGHSYCSCATWSAACAVAGVVMELVLTALDQPIEETPDA